MGSRLPYPRALQRAISGDFQRLRPSANSMAAAVALCAASSLVGSPRAEAAGTYVVNNSSDSGTGSLREAIGLANGTPGNTVMFNASLKGSTITLTTGDIEIKQPMTIDGPGENLLTISGGHNSRIFYALTFSSAYVEINLLTLTAGNAGASHGGAIYALNSALSLNHVTVSDCTAAQGGGIYLYTGALSLTDSRVTGNASGSSGGGIVAIDAGLGIIGSTISANTAGGYGGGVFASLIPSPKSILIFRSTISGNSVQQPAGFVLQGGGGIALSQAASATQVLITTSTVAHNYAYQNGGGVALLDTGTAAKTMFVAATISGNASAASSGNGITAPDGATVGAVRSIVSGNGSRNGLSDLSGTFDLTTCLVQNPDSATITPTSSGNLFLADPQLSALADHGGLTWTLLPSAGSPAVDTGPSCSPTGDDQRGSPFSRCVNGKVDIGAVERQNPEDVIFRDGFNTST